MERNIYFKCICGKVLAVDGGCCERQGFSLVEVTLAMMVIAIGLLSIISLFTAGLDQNKRSINDTQAAFFAEEVFNGLLAASEGNEQKIPSDEISWAAIGVSVTNLIIAADCAWDNPETLDVIMDNNIHTNVYRLHDDKNIENHSFRYSLSIERKDRCIKSATLCVYPGEFGSTNDFHVFYMSLFNYQLQNP